MAAVARFLNEELLELAHHGAGIVRGDCRPQVTQNAPEQVVEAQSYMAHKNRCELLPIDVREVGAQQGSFSHASRTKDRDNALV
jgi:hypothetical protein